jgi:hypothetical protein
MSKFSLPTFLFASLIFISFTVNPGQGVTRLGKFTYNVSSTARVQESEKQEILSILKATYGIKDINTAREITLKPIPLDGAKGKNPNWVVDTKAFVFAIDKKAIHYDNVPKDPKAPATDGSFMRLNNILTKYADMN